MRKRRTRPSASSTPSAPRTAPSEDESATPISEARSFRLQAEEPELKEQDVAKAVMTQVELEPIDRLEEKVKLLVGLIDRLRGDQTRASEENARLSRELDGMRARLAEAEGTSTELAALRQERELIRSRVGDMLAQIEHLNL
jgi:regulator of replication initiation timing